MATGPKKNQLYLLAGNNVYRLGKNRKFSVVYKKAKDLSIGIDGRLHVVTLDNEILWPDCQPRETKHTPLEESK